MRDLNPKGQSGQRNPCVQRHTALRIADVMAGGGCSAGLKQRKMKLVRSMGPGCEGTCVPC